MKKFLLIIISASAIFAAYGREYGGRLNDSITWRLTDSVLTISGSGEMPSYAPSELSRNPLQNEDMALGVHTIIIEEGITAIGNFSFGQRRDVRNGNHPELYANLRRIYLPKTLRKIGHHAFTRVPVSNIFLPDGIEDIGASAFANSLLRYVKLPASLKHLGPEAFLQCPNLIGIDLNNLSIGLGTGTFFNCEQLQIVCHTQNITDIAPSTFDATRLSRSTPEFLLACFKQDGLQYCIQNGQTAREYYKSEAENLTTLFILDELTLTPYDPESGTCRLQTVCHGDFLIPIKRYQEEDLRKNWRQISLACRPTFVPRHGKLLMQSLTLELPDGTKLIAAPIPDSTGALPRTLSSSTTL